jgi:hypothetical protein
MCLHEEQKQIGKNLSMRAMISSRAWLLPLQPLHQLAAATSPRAWLLPALAAAPRVQLPSPTAAPPRCLPPQRPF